MQVFQKIARELVRPYRQWRQAGQVPVRKRQADERQARGRAAGDRQAERKPQPGSDTRLQALNYCHDFLPEEIEIIRAVLPLTMTTVERVWAVIQAVRHVVRLKIPGDIVECGVWRGGSMMAAGLTLLQLGEVERTLHLYDTFEGMPAPGERDRDFAGRTAAEQLQGADRATSNIWARAGLEEVQTNLFATGYPRGRLRFIPGKVEETIPAQAPEQIALLRLDTDWYESTRHELVHLYPRLTPGGILIIDDYGYWQGARRATDEYFESLAAPPFLSRIDSTGRLAVKAA